MPFLPVRSSIHNSVSADDTAEPTTELRENTNLSWHLYSGKLRLKSFVFWVVKEAGRRLQNGGTSEQGGNLDFCTEWNIQLPPPLRPEVLG
jgi:hypothetical protein